MSPSLVLATGAWLGSAHAFCGAYVGAADSNLTNSDSRIVIARNGVDTRLTMFNEVGDMSEEFGLIVPIPHKVDARHVRLVDVDALTVTEKYAEPRLVEYTCENFYTNDESLKASVHPFLATGCDSYSPGPNFYDTGPPAWVDTATGVVVEENFVLGEYDVFVLKAGAAEGLLSWLDTNGFTASNETMEVLQDYIDDGQYFLAARIDPALMTSHWLSPLQIHYQTDSLTLPIRLGATSSAGVQDLVVTIIGDANLGRVGISNYPETLVDRDCMVDDWRYGEMWTELSGIPDDAEQAEGIDRLAWTTEYSWSVPGISDYTLDSNGQVWGTVNGVKCDPCTEPPPEAKSGDDPFPDWVPQELGYAWPEGGYHFTRLRLRYTPGGVTQDLVFYDSFDQERQQNRYIVHKWELESLVPMCGDEQPEDPGACYTSEYWARQAQGEINDPVGLEATNACGCSSSSRGGGALVVAGLLGLLALTRRP